MPIAFEIRGEYIQLDQLLKSTGLCHSGGFAHAEIEAGNVSFNTLEASLPETPFGGVKSSGYGREGGIEGLNNYMIIKNISHSMKIV